MGEGAEGTREEVRAGTGGVGDSITRGELVKQMYGEIGNRVVGTRANLRISGVASEGTVGTGSLDGGRMPGGG